MSKIQIEPQWLHLEDFMSVWEYEWFLIDIDWFRDDIMRYIVLKTRINLRKFAEEILSIPHPNYSTYNFKTNKCDEIRYS